MPYGAHRLRVYLDTFDAILDTSAWDTGHAANGPLVWVSGGYVRGDGSSYSSTLRPITGTFNADQYARVTLHSTYTPAGGTAGAAAVRFQAGDSDSSHYMGGVSGFDADAFYMNEVASDASQARIATGGSASGVVANDVVTLEIEGTTLRLGATVAGSADIERLTTTDNTLSTGKPGTSGDSNWYVTTLEVGTTQPTPPWTIPTITG